MGYALRSAFPASALAEALGLRFSGEDRLIQGVAKLDEASVGILTFQKSRQMTALPGVVAIAPPDHRYNGESCLIHSENCRLDFIRALVFLDVSIGIDRNIPETYISSKALIAGSAIIESGVVIEDAAVIEPGVIVKSGSRIGQSTIIRANTVIGAEGFGFERDASGRPHRFLHLGGVRIGADVEIGSNNTVCKGALSDTIVHDGVKTDCLVHIAHNCEIGENAIITACAALSGGVKLGRNVWIGPNSSVIEKACLGDRAFIGIGANVIRDVARDSVVAGNPARDVKKR